MIHRAIILLFEVLAAATLVLGMLSYVVPTAAPAYPMLLDAGNMPDGISVGFRNGNLGFRIEHTSYRRAMPVGAYFARRPTGHTTVYNFNSQALGRFRLYYTDFSPKFPRTLTPTAVVRICAHLDLMWRAHFFTWFLLFASYPLLALNVGRLWRYLRRRKGFCGKCGYDLTGNISGTCPECGAKVKGP